MNPFIPPEILEWGRALFALVLSGLTLYSWLRRKQTALLAVTVAFLLFFFKTFLDEFVSGIPYKDDLFTAFDLVALGLFFAAIIVRPKKSESRVNA